MSKAIITVMLFFTASYLFSQNFHIYPSAPKDDSVNTYYDTAIIDPYQWMENPNDVRLAIWLKEQQDLTKNVKHKMVHFETLESKLRSMYYSLWEEVNDSYLEYSEQKYEQRTNKYDFSYHYRHNTSSLELYFKKKDGINFTRIVDSRKHNLHDYEKAIIEGKRVNEKNDLLAVEFSINGSDWRHLLFYDLKTGLQLQDTIKFLRNTSQYIWFKDGLLYDRYEEPKQGRELLDAAKKQALYYHKIGTSQNEDIKLYENPDSTATNKFSFGIRDSLILFNHFVYPKGQIYAAKGCGYLNTDESFFIKDYLIYPKSNDISFQVEEIFGDTLILRSTMGAPLGKVFMCPKNQRNKLTELVKEFDRNLVQVNRLDADKIACIYLKDGDYNAHIYNLKGELLKIFDFPKGKKLIGFYESDTTVDFTTFALTSFYHPRLKYQLDLNDLTFNPVNQISVPYEPGSMHTQYVKYPSKDGTEIGMYVTCRKDIKLDGSNPTLIYGYGGYGHTVGPSFNRLQALWLAHGGVFVVPNIRGGGAQGQTWSEQGRGINKQNAIDDFIAAAEFLVEQKYTSPEYLGIKGGSHGGMLVAAAMTQRPELYKAVVAESGIFDMIRFENYTVGSVQLSRDEFGSVSNREEFNNLLSYSPLHQIKDGISYPSLLLVTGDSDDRVPPMHSYKFLATIQEKGLPQSLYHLYVNQNASHSGATTVKDAWQAELFKYYFLFDQLGIDFNLSRFDY
ncbi:MAG: prolyl oligopeptidase family serine peptidase [bacterium]|nr:prolyl oligopeptidase family serine peptidase [bacterium]